MGEALLGGLLATEWAKAEELAVSEKLPGLRAALSERHPGVAVGPTPVVADGTVLAVKPDDAEVACRQVAEAGVERLLSIVLPSSGREPPQSQPVAGPGRPR
jgi:pyrroline-5-carboxylate reductase